MHRLPWAAAGALVILLANVVGAEPSIRLTSFALAPDGRHAFFGRSDGIISRFDMATGDRVDARAGLTTVRLALSEDGDHLTAIGTYGCGLLHIDPHTMQIRNHFPPGVGAPRSLQVSPTGHAAVFAATSYLHFTDVRGDRETRRVSPATPGPQPVMSRDGNFVFVATTQMSFELAVYGSARGQQRRSLPIPRGFIPLQSATDTLTWLRPSSSSRIIMAVDTSFGTPVLAAALPVGNARYVAPDPEHRFVYVATTPCTGTANCLPQQADCEDGTILCDHGTVEVIDTASGQTVRSIPLAHRPRGGIAVAPSGDHVVVSHRTHGRITLVDTRTWAISLVDVAGPDTGSVELQTDFELAFLAGGTGLHVATDRGVTLVDLEAGSAEVVLHANDMIGANAEEASGLPESFARQRAYLGETDGHLSIYDGTSLTGRVFMGGTPVDIAISEDQLRVYVLTHAPTCSRDACVSELVVIDAVDLAVVASASFDGLATRVALGADEQVTYLSFWKGPVVAIDTATLATIASSDAFANVKSMAAKRAGAHIHILADGHLHEVDPLDWSVASTTRVAERDFSGHLGSSPSGDFVFVWPIPSLSLHGAPSLGIVDLSTRQLRRLPKLTAASQPVQRNSNESAGAIASGCWQRFKEGTTLASMQVQAVPLAHRVNRATMGPDPSMLYALEINSDRLLVLSRDDGSLLGHFPVSESTEVIAVGMNPWAPPAATATARPEPTSTPTETTVSPVPATATPTSRSSATPTPTSPIAATPSATATAQTAPIEIVVGSASGIPGETIAFSVEMQARGAAVGGVQFDLTFDHVLATLDCRPGLGHPEVTERIEAHADFVRAIFFRMDLGAIPDESTLLQCTGPIRDDAAAGDHRLAAINVIASDTRGGRLAVRATAGTVDVDRSGMHPTGQEQWHAGSAGGCGIGADDDRSWPAPLVLAWLAWLLFRPPTAAARGPHGRERAATAGAPD